MSGGQDDGFLSRWSRRKAAVQEREAPPEPEVPPEGQTVQEAPPEDQVDEAYIAALPPLDSITAATDLAPFLRKGVPALLRNAALRRMWTADPLIRDHLDVARDYFWDWNAPGGVPGGGGSLSPDAVARMARAVSGAPDPAPQDAPDAPPDPIPDAPAPLAAADPEAAAPDSTAPALQPDDEPGPSAPLRHAAAPVPEIPPRKRHGGAVPG